MPRAGAKRREEVSQRHQCGSGDGQGLEVRGAPRHQGIDEDAAAPGEAGGEGADEGDERFVALL